MNNKINDLVLRLESWYQEHCDGDWEHSFGVSIDTLDNPGWSIKIDIQETEQEDVTFEPVSLDRSEHDWIRCKVEKGIFHGVGGTGNLREILEIFFTWTTRS